MYGLIWTYSQCKSSQTEGALRQEAGRCLCTAAACRDFSHCRLLFRPPRHRPTGLAVPESTLGSPPAGPVFKKGKSAPRWLNLVVAFLFLICPQPVISERDLSAPGSPLLHSNASWWIYQSGGSKLWNIKTWFSRPSWFFFFSVQISKKSLLLPHTLQELL